MRNGIYYCRPSSRKIGCIDPPSQRFAAANRLPGGKKHGHEYLIPADASKPGDPRFERFGRGEPFNGKSLSQELAEVIIKTTLPTPRDNPNAIFEMIKDENLRVIPEIFYAYMKGDFECVKHCLTKTKDNDVMKLIACTIAIPTAISTGDYSLYLDTENWPKSIVQKNISADVTAFAQLALASAYASAYAPAMVPGWVKDGDFNAAAPIMKPNAALLRAKYLQCIGQYEAMYSKYSPGTTFILTGIDKGAAMISATHARTGQSVEVDVTVETLEDRLYIFQFYPRQETSASYINGRGQTVNLTSNGDGELVVYEPDGIRSDISLQSGSGSMVYLGTFFIRRH